MHIRKLCGLILILMLMVISAAGQEPQITLLSPTSDYSFTAIHEQKEVKIIGEIESDKPIGRVTAFLKSSKQSEKNDCQLFYLRDVKNRAMFKTQSRVIPHVSTVLVEVALEDGKTFSKSFPLRNACTNKEYEDDFDLIDNPKIHQDAIRGLQFSWDSRYLVSCSDDRTIRIMNTSDRKVVQTLQGHKSYVRQAFFTPDNRYIVSCGDDHTVRLWEWATGKMLHTFDEADKNPIHAMAISPDGRYVAVGTYQIRIWDLVEKKLYTTLEVIHGQICTLAYTPDGRYLISGDQDHSINIWDTVKKENKYLRMDAHTGNVLSLAIDPTMRYLYSGCSDGSVKRWRLLLNPNDAKWEKESHKLWELRLIVIKDRKKDPADISTKVIDGNPEGYATIRRYPIYELNKKPEELLSSQLVSKAKKPFNSFDIEGAIVVLQFNGTGEFLLLVTGQGEVLIYESFTSYKRNSFLLFSTVLCGAFSNDGTLVAVGGANGVIWLYGMK